MLPLSEEGPASEQPTAQDSVPLSKNAQKRLLKAARRAEQKLERRAREKELKKEKKRARAVDAEETSEPRPKRLKITPRPFDARIVVDLGFDDLMFEKVRGGLFTQSAGTNVARYSLLGMRFIVFSNGLHIFITAKICYALHLPRVRFPRRQNQDQARHSRSRYLQAMEKCAMVGRRIRAAMDFDRWTGGFGEYESKGGIPHRGC